jgi:putative spermidine/putrescine transport system permease protein
MSGLDSPTTTTGSGRGPTGTVAVAPDHPPYLLRGRASRPLRRAARVLGAALLIGFVMLPLAAILGSSVTTTPFWRFPPEGFTLAWYERFFADPELVRSLVLSLATGLFAGLVGTAVSLVSAVGIERARGRVSRVAGIAVLLPLLVPNIALGLGIYMLYVELGVRVNALALGLAQLIIVLPITIRMLMVAVGGVTPNVERAAANLGASPLRVHLRVTLPIVRPSLIAAGVMGFVLAFDDAAIALFVNAPGTVTLPVRMLLSLDHESGPLVAAAGSLLLLVALVLIVALELTVGLAKAFGVKDVKR